MGVHFYAQLYVGAKIEDLGVLETPIVKKETRYDELTGKPYEKEFSSTNCQIGKQSFADCKLMSVLKDLSSEDVYYTEHSPDSNMIEAILDAEIGVFGLPYDHYFVDRMSFDELKRQAYIGRHVGTAYEGEMNPVDLSEINSKVEEVKALLNTHFGYTGDVKVYIRCDGS